MILGQRSFGVNRSSNKHIANTYLKKGRFDRFDILCAGVPSEEQGHLPLTKVTSSEVSSDLMFVVYSMCCGMCKLLHLVEDPWSNEGHFFIITYMKYQDSITHLHVSQISRC